MEEDPQGVQGEYVCAMIESDGYLLNLHFVLRAYLSVKEQFVLLWHKVWNV